MTIKPGEIWLADIPFTNAAGSKRRPVLILWLDGVDMVAAAITSVGPRSVTDVPLSDWKSCGLRVPSTVRLSRLDCLEQSLLIARFGSVSKSDGDAIKAVWNQQMQLDF